MCAPNFMIRAVPSQAHVLLVMLKQAEQDAPSSGWRGVLKSDVRKLLPDKLIQPGDSDEGRMGTPLYKLFHYYKKEVNFTHEHLRTMLELLSTEWVGVQQAGSFLAACTNAFVCIVPSAHAHACAHALLTGQLGGGPV